MATIHNPNLQPPILASKPVARVQEVTAIKSNQRWRAYARCVGTDPNVFYPAEGQTITFSSRRRWEWTEIRKNKAKAVCRSCPVRPECREYALEVNERLGVWGGLTEGERCRIRKMRKAVGVPVRRRTTFR